MAEALLHPRHGYYTTGDPFGAAGDFVTAPEISQMFGELVGLWCADTWDRLGRPDPVHLVELGPGRGTLMQDALRAVRVAPAFRAALRLHLVEASPALRARQAEVLAGAAPTWHDGLDRLPDGPLLIVANEFFDALPIRQFVRTPKGWNERLVDADPAGDGLRFVVASRPGPSSILVPAGLAPAPPGSIAELCPAGLSVAAALAERLGRWGGAVLVIDYGYAGPGIGDTLQAVSRHAFADVLDRPGAADLTAHVDFAALASAAGAAEVAVHGPIGQGAFLCALGIEARAAQLRRTATAAQAEAIDAACARLIGDAEMGTLFKVMAFASHGLGLPAGFSA
ncbi:MAG: class I SAM-dependent methyltransferase [Azospirillum sp.]|nr:class I SAM-dependent methyltransferase [Azospirillum sp.]